MSKVTGGAPDWGRQQGWVVMDQRVTAGRSEMRIGNCRLKGGHSRHFRPLHLSLFLGVSRTRLESLGQEAAKLWGKGMKVGRRMGCRLLGDT